MFNQKKYMKQWRKDNSEHIKKYKKEYQEENKEKLSEQRKKRYRNNRKKELTQMKKWRNNNLKHYKEYQKQYQKTENGKANHWKGNKKYDGTEKGKLTKSKADKKWREANPEKVKKRHKKFRENNPEYNKDWIKTEKGKANSQRGRTTRRAKEREIINTLTAQEWLDILEKNNYVCAYCGKKLIDSFDTTRDHIIPVNKGGNNIKENIVPACRSCNSKKNNKILIGER